MVRGLLRARCRLRNLGAIEPGRLRQKRLALSDVSQLRAQKGPIDGEHRKQVMGGGRPVVTHIALEGERRSGGMIADARREPLLFLAQLVVDHEPHAGKGGHDEYRGQNQKKF